MPRDRILPAVEVAYRIAVSQSSLYRMVADGLFPEPISIGVQLRGAGARRLWSTSRIASKTAGEEGCGVNGRFHNRKATS